MYTECPNCKSFHLRVITRKSYLLTAFLFLIAAVIFFLVSEFMPGLNHYIALSFVILSIIAVLTFVIYLIFSAMQISPTYRCKACGYQFWGRS